MLASGYASATGGGEAVESPEEAGGSCGGQVGGVDGGLRSWVLSLGMCRLTHRFCRTLTGALLMGGQTDIVGVVGPSGQYKERCWLRLERKVTRKQHTGIGEVHGSAPCVALFQAWQSTASVSTLSRHFCRTQRRTLRLRRQKDSLCWGAAGLASAGSVLCVVTAQVATCRPCVGSFG